MKSNYLKLAALTLTMGVSVSCRDHDYTSNDPNTNLDAPAYYDVQDLHQTYHTYWKPAKGWVGDPMPYHENGEYHLMYLFDARDGAPTFHPWAMASTTDLVTYSNQGVIIPCGEVGSQENALGTGSIIKVADTYYAYYTAHNGDMEPKEKIYLATSKDLLNWEKQPAFSLQAPEGYDANDFRDPFLFKDGNEYKMLVTTRGYVAEVADWQAVIAQFSSTDLWNWTLDDPFYFNGERILECPDFFVMGEYEYLIYSNWDWADQDRTVQYCYRPQGTSEWKTPAVKQLDTNAYYAAKTAGEGNQRYLFGWCPTRVHANDRSEYNWGGSLVTHQLAQKENGELGLKVPDKILTHLSQTTHPQPLVIQQAQVADNNNYLVGEGQKDGLVLFDRMKGLHSISFTLQNTDATRFGIELGAGGIRNEVHHITFDTHKKQLALEHITDGDVVNKSVRSLDIDWDQAVKVRLVLENAVCVVYINDEVAFTNRIYQMNQNPWGLFSESGSVEFQDVTVLQ